MKKTAKFISLITLMLMMVTTLLAGCEKTTETTKKVSVVASQPIIDVEQDAVDTLDFTKLFKITVDDEQIEVKASYIDLGGLCTKVGTYTVTCTYEEKSASIIVNVNKSESNIVVNKKVTSIDIKINEVDTYDFTTLFTISEKGNNVTVEESFVDHLKVIAKAGTYKVTCTYKGVSETITVNVKDTVYELRLSVDEVKVTVDTALNYDYLALFTAFVDNERIDITSEMVESTVRAEIGTYYVKVTNGKVSKTLKVVVTSGKVLEVIPSYKTLDLTEEELSTYDFTNLFSLYIDGAAVEVTLSMIDTSALNNATVGNTYNVVFNYTYEGLKYSETVSIKVVENATVQIKAKNVVTYPNGEYIDLTTLFEITIGDKNIPVTMDMITGTIDYTEVGENIITLNYNGLTKQAIVEVKRGVIIEHSKSDTITILKGTNKDNYNFIEDFKVIINGIRFRNISDTYLNLSTVDFNTVGNYTVTLKIPYNEKNIGLSGVKFTYYEKTITYVVVSNNYKVDVVKDLVTLPINSTSYDVYSNLTVTINGRKQQLTENPNYADPITCYAKLLSSKIDFNYVGEQTVKIAVYVDGPDMEPVIVIYRVIIESNVKVDTIDKVIFTGDTLYTTQLFSITEDGNRVDVLSEYITGKVNTFKAGVYYININYKGIAKTSKVVVISNSIKGVYTTKLTTIPEVIDDGDVDYTGEFGDEQPSYEVVKSEVKVLKNLVIDQEGNITVNGYNAELIDAINENTLIIKINTMTYTMYFDNGIVVINPDNSIKMTFSENRRPLIYFHSDIWETLTLVTVNYSDDHVLEGTTTVYSIDCVKIRNIATDEIMWYGLKIRLAEKTSTDTVYVVDWGKAEFDLSGDSKIPSTLYFNGDIYSFTQVNKNTGKIVKESGEKKFANMVFKGTIDGKEAELRADRFEGYTLVVDSKTIFTISSYEIGTMTYGGSNYVTNVVMLYQCDNDDYYSYKFNVDPVNKTFEYVEKDSFYGKYGSTNQYIFLDGYGRGVVKFDAKNYTKTAINYTTRNQEVMVKYVDTTPSFAHGTEASFYLDPLGNVLTAKQFDNGKKDGMAFENTKVTDGAIIRIKSYEVGQNSDSFAKANLYNNIEIITKDGVISNDEKAKYIDTSKIRFNTPGFYQLAIKVTINGEEITAYYAIQIIATIYKDNPVVGSYGSGVIAETNQLVIDEYGRAYLECSGILFEGTVKIAEDNSFVIKAKNATKGSIVANGTYIAPGIILLKCGGAASFSDYFTFGTSKVTGNKNLVLRQIIVDGNITYIMSITATSIGEIVNVESANGVSPTESGSIVKVVASSGISYVKIVNWDDAKNGIQLADEYRGTYKLSGSDDLVLDGFGNATLGDKVGTYTIEDDVVTLSMDSQTKVYRVDKVAYTYEVVNISLDNSLLEGKTYEASHVFTCGNFRYTANTSFQFGANGVVKVISTSASHDDGEDACGEDLYEPKYASKKGVEGTYVVTGNRVTITVNGYVFVFTINNVVKTNKITCSSTTVQKDAHGYFAVDTVFTLK